MRFTHEDSLYELDESSITFAEAELVEEICGLPFHIVGAQVLAGALRPQRAFAYITMKRVNPKITFDELALFPIESIVWKYETTDGQGGEKKARKTRSKGSSEKSQA